MNKNLRRAILGGIISALVTMSGAYVLGHISGYEARELMEAALPGINTLCNTVVLASATILALLLTLLGISSNANSKLKENHYYRIKQIALFDTILFVSAMITFLVFNIPIAKSDNVPGSWFANIYYSTLAASSLLGGMLISVVLMLYSTVSDMIHIIGLGIEDHPLAEKNEEKKESSSIEN
jgi:hypothetical protein